MQKCLKIENRKDIFVSSAKAQDILEKIENKTTFETNEILSKEFNQPIQVHEISKPQSDDSVRLEITLSRSEYESLKHAKDLLSHTCPGNTWKEVIVTLAKKFNQTKIAQSKNIKSKSGSALAVVTASPSDSKKSTQSFVNKQVSFQKARPYISVITKREVFTKAQNHCQYIDRQSGRKCTATFQLELDHIKPVALNGDSGVNNLRVLCRTHNQLLAKRAGLTK